METKFLAWDWEIGELREIPSDNVVEAIYMAWNYEFDVYEADTKKPIFSGKLSNEENSELLKKYGLRLIDLGRRFGNVQKDSNGYEWCQDYLDHFDDIDWDERS